MPGWVARKPSSGLKESKNFFWTPQPLRRCECRAVLAYNPASDQSYGLCERYPQRTSRDNYRRACAGFLVSCSGHEWVESNWTGCRRGRARRKYSFAAILDSSPGALRVVLCGQPARKQAPENILVLDSDAHGFLIQSRDCGFDHLPDCACRTSLRPGNSGPSGSEAIYRHLPGFGQNLRRMGSMRRYFDSKSRAARSHSEGAVLPAPSSTRKAGRPSEHLVQAPKFQSPALP